MASEALTAQPVTFPGSGGDPLEAYAATPMDDGRRGGVVVIHHLPGYDRGTREITRRFAELGYDAVCPNLYSRISPGSAHDDQAAAARAQGGVPDEQVTGDVAGAAAWLRARPASNGKVATIGYCSGGRQSFLAGISLDTDATIVCYGGLIVGPRPEQAPASMVPLIDRTGSLGSPLLGLWGNNDQFPRPEQVDELEQALRSAGRDYEFHRYDGAGHAFFSVDRASYRPEAAVDGWERIASFLARTLG